MLLTFTSNLTWTTQILWNKKCVPQNVSMMIPFKTSYLSKKYKCLTICDFYQVEGENPCYDKFLSSFCKQSMFIVLLFVFMDNVFYILMQ